MTTPEKIVESILAAKQATNINNILTTTNNTNNINNKITLTIVDEINNDVDQSLRSPLGLASLSASQDIPESLSSPRDPIDFVGGSELPAAWLNFKWDLFRNPSTSPVDQLKLNLNIVRQDGTQIKLTASLNSPHDRVWRKVTDEELDDPHWQLVADQYKIWRRTYGPKITDWRASKFYLPGKKEGGRNVVFVREEPEEYQLRLFYRATMLDYVIPKSSIEKLTNKQLAANQIASLFIGKRAKALLTEDDLGI